MGWCGPKTPRGQQRRESSDRTSERSRHLVGARVVWEAKGDEKTGFATASFFLLGAVGGLLRARGRRYLGCDRSGGPCLSRLRNLASEAVDDKAQVCVACFGFMGHATSSWTKLSPD